MLLQQGEHDGSAGQTVCCVRFLPEIKLAMQFFPQSMRLILEEKTAPLEIKPEAPRLRNAVLDGNKSQIESAARERCKIDFLATEVTRTCDSDTHF
jgi:hypothetical protein